MGVTKITIRQSPRLPLQMATDGEIGVFQFREGMAIEVTYLTPDYGRPTLDLKDSIDNIVLHVNPRWDEGSFVLNTRCDGSWGQEERPKGFDFSSGVPITLRVEGSSTFLNVYINNRMIHQYRHRMPMSSICKAYFYWFETHATKHAQLISLAVFYS